MVDQPKGSRLVQLESWLKARFELSSLNLSVVCGDASFRRYFRFSHNGTSYIAVDAPSDKEDSRRFVAMAEAYRAAGLTVPEVIEVDFAQGFMCLSDLGDELLLLHLNSSNVDDYYQQALALLVKSSKVSFTKDGPLPLYDEAFLRREMGLFDEWFLQGHLNVHLTEQQQVTLNDTIDCLADSALSQMYVGVHRDYHSRNLMLTAQNHMAVIDFQDAVVGPITYDAVSLLRDCYVVWPDELIYRHVLAFKQQMGQVYPDLQDLSDKVFIRQFDLMGLQRHIKVCGIFTRLYHRDGKTGYLKDIPTVLDYIIAVAVKYDEFRDFVELLKIVVKPALQLHYLAQAQQQDHQQEQKS